MNEPRLTVTYNDTDWYTWTAQATGKMSVGVLFTAAQGQLGFKMYADANGNGNSVGYAHSNGNAYINGSSVGYAHSDGN